MTVKGVLVSAEGKIDSAFEDQPLVEAAVRHTMGVVYCRLGEYKDAKRHLLRAMELRTRLLGPERPRTLHSMNNLAIVSAGQARFLTTCADLKLRDPEGALQLAMDAVKLATQSSYCWQVLGWAHYRTGAWQASVEALEKSMQLQKDPAGGDSFQWFFLAMAHWQLGQKEEARQWYGRAVEWMDKEMPKNELLRRIRTEAATLLGLAEQTTQVGEEVVPGEDQ